MASTFSKPKTHPRENRRIGEPHLALANPSKATQELPKQAPALGNQITLTEFLKQQSLASNEIDQQRPTPPSSTQKAILQAKNLHKSYFKNKLEVSVLRGVDFAIETGEFVSIIGSSGSGKSTLLHLLGTLDEPDQGKIYFRSRRIDDLPSKKRDSIRSNDFGMIFQFYHLLPELTTLENVLTPAMISNSVFQYYRQKKKLVARAKELLELVGLSHRLKHKPRELSGGEMQRAAIARALISKPTLLLADEPTGNLDQKTGTEILSLLQHLNQEEKLTICMVTHDQQIAKETSRIVQLAEGKVQYEHYQ
ncbi:MAG: ATP-binding cassette domain-containing protein [Pirellulaceae bacterium]|nr:ATP-binding cassette domain-containing protein [Pirellulaceae bacterium]